MAVPVVDILLSDAICLMPVVYLNVTCEWLPLVQKGLDDSKSVDVEL